MRNNTTIKPNVTISKADKVTLLVNSKATEIGTPTALEFSSSGYLFVKIVDDNGIESIARYSPEAIYQVK